MTNIKIGTTLGGHVTILEKGIVELSGENVWMSVKIVLGEVIRKSNVVIKGLSIASFGESFILVDENGHQLCDSILFSDIRQTVRKSLTYIQNMSFERCCVC